MTDTDLRSLERAVDETGDPDARRRLTRERLRAGRGVVAWWQGPEPPHASAARASMRREQPDLAGNGEDRPPIVTRTEGWALAVGSAADVFEVGQAARSVVLLDLADGRWCRLAARRSGLDLGALNLAAEVTTTDALGRPRAKGDRTTRGAFDASRVWDRQDGIAGVWQEATIWDSEWWHRRDATVKAFMNFVQFSACALPETLARSQKIHGVDTNCVGSTMIPQGWQADFTGISVQLLDGERRPLPADRARAVAAGARLSLGGYSTPRQDWPLDELLEEGGPPGEGEFTVARIAPPVMPFAWPYRPGSLEYHPVCLEGPPRAEDVLVRVKFAGFVGRGMV